MEPLAEFWEPSPSRAVELPDGYVPSDALTEQPRGLHRRTYALVILLAVSSTQNLFILLSLLPDAGELEWATLSPNGGFRYIAGFSLSVAAFVLCAQGLLLGRIVAALDGVASSAWVVATLVQILDQPFGDDSFASRWSLWALAALVFPVFQLVLAAIAPTPQQQPHERRPRFDPYTLNPYDDHPAFEGPDPSTQAADVAVEATIDAGDDMWRPKDA